MPDFDTAADIVMPVLGIVLYLCLFVYALGVLYSTRYIQKLRKKGLKFDEWLPLFFLILTIWFAVLRVPWHMFKMVPGQLHDDTFFLLRFILLFHHTSFVLIAIEWTLLLHRAALKRRIAETTLRKVLFSVFGIVVGCIYVHTLVLFGVIDGKREGNIQFEVNIQLFTFLALLIAVLFIVYPARLLRMVHRSTSARKRQQVRKLLTVALLYLLCFLARAVGLLYRPITQQFMPTWLFWLVTYWLPELLPTSYQCYLLHVKLLKHWRRVREGSSLQLSQQGSKARGSKAQGSTAQGSAPRSSSSTPQGLSVAPNV